MRIEQLQVPASIVFVLLGLLCMAQQTNQVKPVPLQGLRTITLPPGMNPFLPGQTSAVSLPPGMNPFLPGQTSAVSLSPGMNPFFPGQTSAVPRGLQPMPFAVPTPSAVPKPPTQLVPPVAPPATLPTGEESVATPDEPVEEEVVEIMEGEDEELPAEEDITEAILPQSGMAVAPDGEQLVGLKYEKIDADEVLKQYADWTSLAIMKAPNVPNPKITLKCPKRLPKREALLAIEAVLGMNGIALVPMGDKFLKVVTISAARQSGMVTGVGPLEKNIADTDHLVSRIIQLKHVEFGDVQGTIQSLLHSYGKILPLERINCLLITDSAINIKRVLEVLELIDQPVELREEMRIFPILYAKASEIQAKIEAIIADAQGREIRTRLIRRQLTSLKLPRSPIRMPSVSPSATSQSKTKHGLIRGKVKMVADDRTNVLIIITKPDHFSFLQNIIAALDKQVEPYTTIKVFRLEFASAKDVVSTLTSLISAQSSNVKKPVVQITAPPSPIDPRKTGTTKTGSTDEVQISGQISSDVKIIADTRINALLVMANRSDMRVIEELLTKLDIMLSQVLIEVIIIEVGLDDEIATGIDWLQRSMTAYNENNSGKKRPFLSFAGTSRSGTEGTLKNATLINAIADSTTTAASGLSYYLTLFDLNIDAVLNMIASSSKARILSTPIILTTDNKEARIMVGEKRPIVTSTSFTSGGTQQSAYEYKDIGIELKVTPHINKKGFVVMEIIQKVDNVGTEVIIDNNKVPVITTREFGASIAVDDRRTIVMGGLVSNEQKKVRRGIPFLSNIPLLGILFRYDADQTQRRELIVLITPYVLDTPDKVFKETKRRHFAIDKGENLFPTGWTGSELVNPELGEPKGLRRTDGKRTRVVPAEALGTYSESGASTHQPIP